MKVLHQADTTLLKLLPKQELREDTVYVPSQFALAFEHKGKRYVFHTLTAQLSEADLPRSVKGIDCERALVEGLFLVPEDKDECAFYESVARLGRLFAKSRDAGTRFQILPTFGCNARCVYCYEEGVHPITMTQEVADQTVRFILEQCKGRPVKLTWFGGEPLLHPGIIDRITGQLKEHGVAYGSRIISNGSLVMPETVRKMKDDWNVGHVQISMDGAEPDYIARKRYYAYRDTYHAVMDAVDLMSAAGIQVVIRCNAEEANWDGMPQFLKDLGARIKHKENVGLYFAPLNQIRAGENDLAMWERIAAIRPLIEKEGIKAHPFLAPRMSFRANACMADAGTFVIAPDGGLHPCEHCPPEARYGDVFHGVTDGAARAAFCDAHETREQCRKCPFLPDCTSFQSCPVQDTHCREARMIFALDVLKRIIDQNAQIDAEEIADC